MPVAVDSTNNIVRFISKKAILSKERILNTDGKTTFLGLTDKITLKSEKILYDEENHRLYWLNVLIGDIKNNITGEIIETNRKKVGAMLGDFVEIGCGSVLNPGTVIGKNTNIYPLSSVRGVVPEDSIYKDENNIVHKV